MDYEGEQQMEIEALEAILMDDIQVRLEFLFQHTEKYPDEEPNVRLRSLYGLNDAEVAEIQAQVNEEAQGNLGMSMVFTLIEVAKEWLRSKGSKEVDDTKGLSEAEIRKLQEEKEEEEIRQNRSMGTPVTTEAFTEWKANFEAEMESLKSAAEASEAKIESKSGQQTGKMTGKAWFMMQDQVAGRVDEGDLSFGDVGDYDEDEDEDEDEEFVDYDDDDDDGMADEYLTEKAAA